MLRTLRRQGAKVLPSNSRVRRRRTSSPPQGPPASRPVGGLRTLRILRENVSASSGSAPPAVGIAARDFRFEARIRRKEVFVGAKCNHAYRQCCARVRSPLEASVQCEQSSALCTSGAGSFQAVTPLPPQAPEEESRPFTPRYAYGVFIPACYSSRPCVFSALCAVLAALRSVLVSKATKPSGQAGHSRPHSLPAVGADSVGIPLRCTRHRLRRGHGARPDGREPSTFDPGMGRSVPDPGGSLPTHNVGLFRCSREPCVSLPRRSRARRPPRCQTPSGATLHFVPRPWLLGDSKPGCRPNGIKNGNDITRITDPP